MNTGDDNDPEELIRAWRALSPGRRAVYSVRLRLILWGGRLVLLLAVALWLMTMG